MYKNGKLSSIRNSDGIWINTQCFREEALHFEKYGYYCPDEEGTPGWLEYWLEQQKRCREGYSVGGVRITADHYYNLNFGRMEKAIQISAKVAKKIESFPDFWDGDYNYYWACDIAQFGISQEEYDALGLEVKILHLGGGKHMIVGKSRRKGYSYKNATRMSRIFNMERNSLVIAAAFKKEYLTGDGVFTKAANHLDFINQHTGFRKNRDYVDKVDSKRASFEEVVNGVRVEKGYKSNMMAITCKDDPDALRGKDAQLVLFEESGAFPNLKATYNATKPALEAGTFTTGQIVIFGTGGDMEKGTKDFADMFYNPDAHGLLAFENIWDEDKVGGKCGFFHPVYWNMEGHYDKEGNSDIKGAIQAEMKTREIIKENSNGSSSEVQKRVQEYPTCPKEAFLLVSHNNFPTIELQAQLDKVKRLGLHQIHGQACILSKEEGKVKVIPDLEGNLNPIWNYKFDESDTTGAVVIYEYPISEKPPKGLYKIGYDPYRQDKGTSLAGVYVYKGVHRGSYNNDVIVASYIGRPNTSDDVNRKVQLLAELYNAEIMYENEVTHVKSYYNKRNKLHLLASQPDAVISNNIQNSKVARVYGIHMNKKLKDAGLKYIKQWLLTERNIDENGNKILNLETILDIGLLEELIGYNDTDNFDRIMAFMMIMFAVEEEELDKEYSDEQVGITQEDFENFLKNRGIL